MRSGAIGRGGGRGGVLAEHDYGGWEGLTEAEIERCYPGELERRRSNHWRYVVPGGESYELVARRAGRWLSEQDPSSSIVAITHEMVSRVLRGLYLRLPEQQALDLTHPHTRIFVLTEGVVEALEVSLGAA